MPLFGMSYTAAGGSNFDGDVNIITASPAKDYKSYLSIGDLPTSSICA